MRYTLLAVAVTASLVACESRKATDTATAGSATTTTGSATQPTTGSATQPTPRAQLTDLTTASTLAPVRAAFNAKKGEARFLTLLAPT